MQGKQNNKLETLLLTAYMGVGDTYIYIYNTHTHTCMYVHICACIWQLAMAKQRALDLNKFKEVGH